MYNSNISRWCSGEGTTTIRNGIYGVSVVLSNFIIFNCCCIGGMGNKWLLAQNSFIISDPFLLIFCFDMTTNIEQFFFIIIVHFDMNPTQHNYNSVISFLVPKKKEKNFEEKNKMCHKQKVTQFNQNPKIKNNWTAFEHKTVRSPLNCNTHKYIDVRTEKDTEHRQTRPMHPPVQIKWMFFYFCIIVRLMNWILMNGIMMEWV